MENCYLLVRIFILICTMDFSLSQEVIQKPTFPDIFQVEIEGIFNDETELDGSLYYDKKNNRAAIFYTYQNEAVKWIYNFKDSEILSFQGFTCEVSQMSDDPSESFFPYTRDENTGGKVIGSPEEILYFKNSVLDNKEEITTFPANIYKAKVDFAFFGRKNCDVRHIFTKPELETSDCESHECQPKLVSISVVCEAVKGEGDEEGLDESNHAYSFYRFTPRIKNEGVFQPPPGVYCNSTSHQEFPQLPDYFSFSYDFQEDVIEYLNEYAVIATHKKVWYDSSLGLIRLDEFEENGLLVSSRIFDFYGGTAFTIVANLGECEKGALEEEIDLSDLTRLPKLIFQKHIAEGDAVYIGKRKAHGIVYDVWVSSTKNSETDSVRVEEFFFSQVLLDGKSNKKKQLSHVDVYMYGRNPDSQAFELTVNAFYNLNNFRTKPKEWEAFDVSTCFEQDYKKAFKLEVEGPSVVKNSYEYADLLDRLYMKLISYTNVSIIRISELIEIHDGTHLKGFNGWILEKPNVSGAKASELEPDANKAYELLKEASSADKLNIMLSGRDVQYKIKLIIEKEVPDPVEVPRPTFDDSFETEVQGIFLDQKTKVDGRIHYDKLNNRAAISYSYQGDTKMFIYKFNTNELFAINGFTCEVSQMSDDPSETFLPYTRDEETGKKVIGSPEEFFYFKNSVLEKKEEIRPFPAYIYKAKVDFAFLGRKNCDVRHIFTKSEFETSNCESHECQPKLVSISVVCEAVKGEGDEKGLDESNNAFSFYRFTTGIKNEGVFQPPPGVYCNSTSHQEFPQFPDYFSFSYDFQEDVMEYLNEYAVLATHKKVWYDSSLGLIRLDEFEENGLLVSSRIFNFYGGTAFTIVANLGECEKGALEEEIDLSDLTRLPKLIFQKDIAEGDAVYIGKRKAHGIVYDVWVSSTTNSETDSIKVEEFFFSQVLLDGKSKPEKQLSHVDVYMYGRNPDSQAFELTVNAFYNLNNFRTKPKEWEAFDVSTCFEQDHKKAFKLEVEGPSVLKNSYEYADLLERLYMKLIIYTNVSIIRISELTDIHDGTHLKGFNGWILEKPGVPGVNASELEPDVNKAYELLKEASSSDKLNIKIKLSGRDVQYKIKLIIEKEASKSVPDWAIGAITTLTVVSVLIISCWIFYVFKKKKDDSWEHASLQMGRVN